MVLVILLFFFLDYLDFDGKENIHSKKHHDTGKVHESKRKLPTTSSMTKIRSSKSLQIQRPKQSSRREKTRKRSKKRRSKSSCRTAVLEESAQSSDEEILELRLEALSSKAEVKEIAETEGIENVQTLSLSKSFGVR